MSVEFFSYTQRSYEDAHQKMEECVQSIIAGKKKSQIWFLEHEHVYTAGTSAKKEDLLNPLFPVFSIGRGGQYTYHGPGQLIGYAMIKLSKNQQDLKTYVKALMQWIQLSLDELGVKTESDSQNIGLWINSRNGKNKIAAFGIRVTKWVTWHGFSLNINPHLENFSGIIPCGIKEFGVTSLKREGFDISRQKLEDTLKKNFFKIDFFCK